MRLTWQSKMLSGSTTWPVEAFSHVTKLDLALRLALRKVSRKELSPARGFRRLSRLRSVIQASPIALVIAAARSGFARSNQRRGVTPLVLLLKRSGNISARSLTVVVRSRLE